MAGEVARPWLITVWERGFATEDEADEAYEQFMDWLHAPFEVDRFDGYTVRVYLDTKMMESKAQLIEASYTPATLTCPCVCAHIAAAHTGEESLCSVNGCECRGFERAEGPQEAAA
jgi:hypothetical protein